MADPIGADGELVDRLLAAVNSSHDRDWVELGWFLIFAVGGAELMAIEPDTGREPPPGSVGEKRRKTSELVTRSSYIDRIRRRLLSMVRSGVREDFLVRALRDDLTAHCHEFARTEAANTRREEFRARIERGAASAETLAAFRASLAEDDPAAALLNDDQIAQRLRDMASSDLLKPMSRENEQDAWDRTSRWNDQVAAAVSDQALAVWMDRRVRDRRTH